MDNRYFKPWLKHRYIKTMDGSYVRIPENDDHLEFMVDSFVHEVVMVDSKERRTWLTDIGAVSDVLPMLILDELMSFIVDDDMEIIDMYVILEIARDRYDPEKDLPF